MRSVGSQPRLHHLLEVKSPFIVSLRPGVASVTPLYHAAARGHLWLSMLWSLAPIFKNPLFHLPPENFILSWASALPPLEERSLQVRDNHKMASGTTLPFGEAKDVLWVRRTASLTSTMMARQSGMLQVEEGIRSLFKPSKTHSCDPSLGVGGHKHDFGQICPGHGRRGARLKPYPHSTCFADGDQGL